VLTVLQAMHGDEEDRGLSNLVDLRRLLQPSLGLLMAVTITRVYSLLHRVLRASLPDGD
jgi:hypothetical protein